MEGIEDNENEGPIVAAIWSAPMLHLTTKLHRSYLRANAGPQKLFVMLKLLPSPEAARARPKVHLAVVMDTSGSMREPAPGADIRIVPAPPVEIDGKRYNASFEGTTKLEAARRLIDSQTLGVEDTVTLIRFDDDSSVVAQGNPVHDRAELEAGIERLTQFSGGTQMGKGLRNAVDVLDDRDDAARKVLLLTDGLAVDEDLCRAAAGSLAELRAPIVALGVGEEYNEDLLADICNISLGRPYDLRDMTGLPQVFETELGSTAAQVVSDVRLTLRTVRDVKLASAMRSYPSLSDIDTTRDPLPLGNIEAGDHTVFILEIDLPERPPVRTRIAQIGLTYLVPAQGYRGEIPVQDLVVEFTDDESLAAQVDPEVMGYVQQRNVENLIRQATEQAKTNPEQAARTLQVARSMTQRLGNQSMTQALGRAQEELKSSGTIAVGTRKTIKLGARTNTVKAAGPDDPLENLPSEEEIRRLTGA
jgi:Ca-activated chloride channel homolog